VKTFCSLVVCLIAAVATGTCVAGAPAGAVLKRIAAIRELSREDAAQGRPVHIQGVVTWRSADGQFTVQDDSAGIWIGVVRARDAVVDDR